MIHSKAGAFLGWRIARKRGKGMHRNQACFYFIFDFDEPSGITTVNFRNLGYKSRSGWRAFHPSKNLAPNERDKLPGSVRKLKGIFRCNSLDVTYNLTKVRPAATVSEGLNRRETGPVILFKIVPPGKEHPGYYWQE
jgi:hypothetical protein